MKQKNEIVIKKIFQNNFSRNEKTLFETVF